MKILITILLALFLSSHASAEEDSKFKVASLCTDILDQVVALSYNAVRTKQYKANKVLTDSMNPVEKNTYELAYTSKRNFYIDKSYKLATIYNAICKQHINDIYADPSYELKLLGDAVDSYLRDGLMYPNK